MSRVNRIAEALKRSKPPLHILVNFPKDAIVELLSKVTETKFILSATSRAGRRSISRTWGGVGDPRVRHLKESVLVGHRQYDASVDRHDYGKMTPTTCGTESSASVLSLQDASLPTVTATSDEVLTVHKLDQWMMHSTGGVQFADIPPNIKVQPNSGFECFFHAPLHYLAASSAIRGPDLHHFQPNVRQAISAIRSGAILTPELRRGLIGEGVEGEGGQKRGGA